MRTTLKRGVGRGAEVNGNGHAVYPPAAVSAITRYEQPPPPGRSAGGMVRRIILVVVLCALSLALAAAGGLYLWYHETVAAIRCHEADCSKAQKHLVALPGQAAIALVILSPAVTATSGGGDAGADLSRYVLAYSVGGAWMVAAGVADHLLLVRLLPRTGRDFRLKAEATSDA
jgi:putative copper export protein